MASMRVSSDTFSLISLAGANGVRLRNTPPSECSAYMPHSSFSIDSARSISVSSRAGSVFLARRY